MIHILEMFQGLPELPETGYQLQGNTDNLSINLKLSCCRNPLGVKSDPADFLFELMGINCCQLGNGRGFSSPRGTDESMRLSGVPADIPISENTSRRRDLKTSLPHTISVPDFPVNLSKSS